MKNTIKHKKAEGLLALLKASSMTKADKEEIMEQILDKSSKYLGNIDESLADLPQEALENPEIQKLIVKILQVLPETEEVVEILDIEEASNDNIKAKLFLANLG